MDVKEAKKAALENVRNYVKCPECRFTIFELCYKFVCGFVDRNAEFAGRRMEFVQCGKIVFCHSCDHIDAFGMTARLEIGMKLNVFFFCAVLTNFF